MLEVAEGVWQLRGYPRDMFNVYLMGDVLVDTATRWARRRIMRQVRDRPLRLIALTHCHPDHQGAARALCRRFGIPLACHEADVPAMEGRARMEPHNKFLRLGHWFWSGPPHPVEHVLRDGDDLAGFRVLHTPGHTAGHVMFFRATDRVAIAGDLLANMHFLTGEPGLRQPPPFFSADPAQNRRSIQILAGLQPAVVCFGHGPPLRDGTALQRYAERLSCSV
jgi:glyoxylase-like metal-dependent hydrolase (beta-lactamase superfamily II)